MDRMIGCLVLWKCFVACLFGEESQHPTCPHSMHIRKCTHVPPIFKQSSQPLADGFTFRIWFRWVHSMAAPSLSSILFSPAPTQLRRLLLSRVGGGTPVQPIYSGNDSIASPGF